MNPLEIARTLMAAIADYDTCTAMAALDITRLLVQHRKVSELNFNQEMINREIDDLGK